MIEWIGTFDAADKPRPTTACLRVWPNWWELFDPAHGFDLSATDVTERYHAGTEAICKPLKMTDALAIADSLIHSVEESIGEDGDEMRSLLDLQREAMESAEARGHKLGDWESLTVGERSRARCVECGLLVDCVLRPQPNETEVAGQAVATNCIT